MSKPESLSDLKPPRIPFTLESTGAHEHAFRKFTIEDAQWVEDHFSKPVNEIVKNGEVVPLKVLARLWLHQLEDKSPFKPVRERVVDEDTGEEQEVLITGTRKLMRAVTSREVQKVLTLYVGLLGLSLIDTTETAEKKTEPVPEQSIGEPSSSSSNPSVESPKSESGS